MRVTARARVPEPTAREGAPDRVAEALARSLADIAGPGMRAVLLFGSRLVGTAPSPHSAYDFVLVVDAYRAFYERLRASVGHRKSAATLTRLAHVLPPNILAVDPGLPGGEIAKVMVFTAADFARALADDAPDNFLRGRLVQRVAVLGVRDPGVAEEVEGHLAGARRGVLRWVAPSLPERFTAAQLAHRMLEVSYGGEVRPEAKGRVQAVFDAQRGFLEEMYWGVLRELERQGVVLRAGEDPRDGAPTWRLTRRPGAWERTRVSAFFAWSKVRATTRWAKHVATFDDWLTYLQRKVERRTGVRVEVTPLERRFALVLLWPKVFRVLRDLRRGRSPAPQGGPR